MDPDTILQEHPEADLDGNGTVDREEMRSFFGELHGGSHDMIFVSTDGAVHELKEGERNVHVVKIREDDVQDFDFDGDGRLSDEEIQAMKAEHLTWIDEDGVEHTVTAAGDQIFVRIDHRHGDHDVVLIQESESGKMADKGAVIRKKDFLKEHPEADLNGDGVISKQEAEAFAAKLQSKQKSRSKQE
jgi:hypothetical protein